MAVTSQQIIDFLVSNPGLSDAQIVAAMDQYGVSPAQMATAVGLPVAEVQQRYEAVAAPTPVAPVAVAPVAPTPVATPAYVAPVASTPVVQAAAPVAATPVAPAPVASSPSTPAPVSTFEPEQDVSVAPVAQTPVPVTNQQIIDFLIANPNLSDAQIVSAMETYKISPAQMAKAVGLSEGAVGARVAATVAPGSSITLGDTVIAPQYRTTGSGMDQQIGALESFASSKTTGDVNYKAPVGTPVNIYGADGNLINTVKTKKEQSFFGGLVDAFKDPVVLAALGGAAASGLLTGAGAATIGTTGLTAAELALLDLSLGGAGGTAGANTLAAALTTGATVPTLTNLTGGSGTGLLTTPVVPPVTPPVTPPVVPPVVPPVIPPVVPPVVPRPTVIPPLVTSAATSLIPKAVNSLFTPTNLGNLLQTGTQTAAGLLQQQTSKEAAERAQAMIDAETVAAKQAAQFRPIGMTTRFGTSQFGFDPKTGQLTSAGYTLDPQAKNAQDRFVALAEQGLQQAEGAQAQFAPLQAGAQQMFNLGQGYLGGQTDPRLAQIASQYLAQSPESKMLTSLGSQYIAQSPEQVAQNYLNQQMALLQPGRELELANLQNRLQQQGRGGLSVAQGGTMGATTPELQALYNARAQQEAQLAANAQQYGQQQVQFGAGLFGTGQKLGMEGQAFGIDTLAKQQALEQQRLALGTSLYNQGAQTMGQYYAGQTAAYAPYTNAFGQIQGLETAAQQPLTMGAALGQQSAQAGFNVGQLGLKGAGQSVALATGAAATTNPYSTALGGLAGSNAFGQALGGLLGGGLQSAFGQTALGASGFGTGLAYGNEDLGLFL